MKFFYPFAPFREKYGKYHVNREPFNDLTITGECWQVFSWESKSKCDGYNVTHQDFPSAPFQIANINFCVKQEGKGIFES